MQTDKSLDNQLQECQEALGYMSVYQTACQTSRDYYRSQLEKSTQVDEMKILIEIYNNFLRLFLWPVSLLNETNPVWRSLEDSISPLLNNRVVRSLTMLVILSFWLPFVVNRFKALLEYISQYNQENKKKNWLSRLRGGGVIVEPMSVDPDALLDSMDPVFILGQVQGLLTIPKLPIQVPEPVPIVLQQKTVFKKLPKRQRFRRVVQILSIAQFWWATQTLPKNRIGSDLPLATPIVRSSKMYDEAPDAPAFPDRANSSSENGSENPNSNSNHDFDTRGNQGSMQRPIKIQTGSNDQLSLYGPQHSIADIDPAVRRDIEETGKPSKSVKPPRRRWKIKRVRTLSGKSRLRFKRYRLQKNIEKPKSKTLQQMIREHEKSETGRRDSSTDKDQQEFGKNSKSKNQFE